VQLRRHRLLVFEDLGRVSRCGGDGLLIGQIIGRQLGIVVVVFRGCLSAGGAAVRVRIIEADTWRSYPDGSRICDPNAIRT